MLHYSWYSVGAPERWTNMEIKFSSSIKGPDNQKYEPKIVNIFFSISSNFC